MFWCSFNSHIIPIIVFTSISMKSKQYFHVFHLELSSSAASSHFDIFGRWININFTINEEVIHISDKCRKMKRSQCFKHLTIWRTFWNWYQCQSFYASTQCINQTIKSAKTLKCPLQFPNYLELLTFHTHNQVFLE